MRFMVIVRSTQGKVVDTIRKMLRPLLVVFGFLLIFFTATSKVPKFSSGDNQADFNDSGVAHADAPPSCGDSGCAASG
jgi:hypothetical protein